MVVPATYGSLDAARRNAQRKAPLPRAEITEDVTFELGPLPVWAHLSPDELRAVVEVMPLMRSPPPPSSDGDAVAP